MEVRLNGLEEDIELLTQYLRPTAVFLGLGVFLLGAVVLGASLAADRAWRLAAYTGPILMVLGVSLIGGALLMEPSEYWLDPEVEFDGIQRYFVVAVSVLFVVFAAAVALLG